MTLHRRFDEEGFFDALAPWAAQAARAANTAAGAASAAAGGSAALAGLPSSERKALATSSTFETGRPGSFDGLTGNFDDMGISWGLLNWNFGAGSLQPILREFLASAPARWRAVFGEDAARFAALIEREGEEAKQRLLAFARAELQRREVRGGKPRWVLDAGWAARFHRLSEEPEMQRLQLRKARAMFPSVVAHCQRFGLRSERAFCMLFDAATSHGQWWLTAKNKQARRELLQRKLAALGAAAAGVPVSEKRTLQAIAEAIAETSKAQWREKVLARKMWFLTGRHSKSDELRGLEPSDAPYRTAVGGGSSATPEMETEAAPAPPKPPSATGAARGTRALAGPPHSSSSATAVISSSSAPAPKLLSREVGPSGTTLYLELGAGVPGARAMTSVFVPHGYRAGARCDVILYLHGHGGPSPIDQYWKVCGPHCMARTPLREQLAASGKNAVLIAPSLGPRSEVGALTRPGELDRFLGSALAGAARHGPWRGRGTQLRHLILAAHSGGGKPMNQLARGGGLAARFHLRQCWALDAFYNARADATWIDWAKRDPRRQLIGLVATAPPITIGAQLIRLAAQQRLGNVHVRKVAPRRDPHWEVVRVEWPRLLAAATMLAPR